MLSSNEESFRLLLESFPRMLLLSIQSHVKPMVEFLEAIGIPKERMRGIFLSFPPIIFFGTEVLKSRIMTFEKVLLIKRKRNFFDFMKGKINKNTTKFYIFSTVLFSTTMVRI